MDIYEGESLGISKFTNQETQGARALEKVPSHENEVSEGVSIFITKKESIYSFPVE